jgi:uncharacterized protein YneF (UPF0154 family)
VNKGASEIVAGLVIALIVGLILGIILSRDSDSYDIAIDRTIGDKLRELPPIFEGARGTIKIATDFDSKFFDKQKVKDAISKAIQNGARVQFITECKPADWYKSTQGIEIKKVDQLSRHIMVIDNDYIRLERPHEPCKFGESKDDAALIFKDFPELAQKYSIGFDSLWTKTS